MLQKRFKTAVGQTSIDFRDSAEDSDDGPPRAANEVGFNEAFSWGSSSEVEHPKSIGKKCTASSDPIL
jgi:hypothetical protein